TVYKKIGETIISSNVKNILSLSNVKTLNEIKNNNEFIIYDNIQLKSINREVNVDRDDNTFNGKKYRIKLWVQTEIYHHILKNKTYRETEYKITNYIRRGGVWFQKKMLTDFDI